MDYFVALSALVTIAWAEPANAQQIKAVLLRRGARAIARALFYTMIRKRNLSASTVSVAKPLSNQRCASIVEQR